MTDILLRPVKTILEDLGLMASTNNEAFQLLSLLLGVLLPNLQTIDLTPMMIKPPIVSQTHLLISKISNIYPEICDIRSMRKPKSNSLPQNYTNTNLDKGCQEIGLVALMFFFELLFSYVSPAISFYVSLTNLFSLILSLIC